MKKHCPIQLLILIGAVLSTVNLAHADGLAMQPPKNGFEVIGGNGLSPFSKNFAADLFSGKLIDVTEAAPGQKNIKQEAATPQSNDEALPSKENAFAYNEVRQADQSKVLGRVDASAPQGFLDMVYKYRQGDEEGAQEGAGEFVDYMTNLMFETREFTKMIGKELIKRQLIDDEEWVGVEQYLDYTFAESRKENGSVIRPTHEEAMKRITSDPKAEAEVYYFFSLGCGQYCLNTSTSVERLWRAVRNDKKVKMAALSMGEKPKAWMDEFRRYTGITLPIFDGKRIAKSFNIAFLPTVVVVSPNTGKAYIKTGEQSFEHLYEFVRTVQGLPVTFSPEVQKVMGESIGERQTMMVKQSAPGDDHRPVANLKDRVAKVFASQPPVSTNEQAKRF